MSVEHYENFPVASWLCPAPLRPPITAIYWFARVADDLADEGAVPPARRRADLAEYRAELARIGAGQAPSPRWAAVFQPLASAIREHDLPLSLLDDLLDAFVQDTSNPIYPDRTALLDYCRRSANPIGRLLLHLYGIREPAALARSDAICSALQLINFWQDLSVDLPRGRHYVPAADAARHGLQVESLRAKPPSPAERALVRELCDWADGLMREGAPLARQVPGRAGWELRLVVQGGLRILEKIAAMDHATFTQRPALTRWDAPRLVWRAWRQTPGAAS
ncbi:squalene synthase HpnC [Ideonella sp.]|uniref:squalene synthase HpnC n=1 Tax=Ideonella sp. TaxID=1929293 RepID=UPI002B47C1D6|nr:squalene synthase HpnC [Ideonella sp.]HJV72364.1 squalene synthase HpnC [Ideonella sp.]